MRPPERMSYIEVVKPGDPDVLRMATGPVPQPKPDEVLIRVLAAGVNRADVSQRRGTYAPPPNASPIIGLEVAGEVVAVGQAATNFKPGDQVCALTNGGGYAEYCTVPEPQCLPWPKGYDAIQAGALPETYFTVWANLFQLGRLAPGESVLVHGGSSGIGVTAIQLAHEFGFGVYATAGSQEKCDACLKLGADAAINYREVDFAERIRELTGGQGVNVVLDVECYEPERQQQAQRERGTLRGDEGHGRRCSSPRGLGGRSLKTLCHARSGGIWHKTLSRTNAAAAAWRPDGDRSSAMARRGAAVT